MTKNLIPMAGNVVILRDEREDFEQARKAGLIVPDTMEKGENPRQYATVMAVGPAIWEWGKEVQLGVEEGDRVLISPYAGTRHFLAPNQYVEVIRYTEIIAKVVEE